MPAVVQPKFSPPNYALQAAASGGLDAGAERQDAAKCGPSVSGIEFRGADIEMPRP